MDAIADPTTLSGTPSKEEAEEAVRTLIRWAGDDPTEEGLIENAGSCRSIVRRILFRIRYGS